MTPRAFAVHGKKVLLAPVDFDWVLARGIAGSWPSGQGDGAKRPEVAQWITQPRKWHRGFREAVKKHEAWMKAAYSPVLKPKR